jgi:dGTPase
MREKVLKLLTELNRDNISEVEETLNMIGDQNEKLSYLRSRAINTLTFSAADVFMQKLDLILNGKYESTLVDELQLRSDALKEIEKISIQKIYNHPTVVEIELAGYNVMKELLSTWIPAAIKTKSERSAPESKVMQLIPEQFGPFEESDSPYSKVMRILDVVSGMTDLYATELYRKIKGIDIGKHK